MNYENFKEALACTKHLLLKAHNINSSIPKGYGVTGYDQFYDMKEELISKAVDNIKTWRLPIKYGISGGYQGGSYPYILYFEFYNGKKRTQVSFHLAYYHYKTNDSITWIGYRQELIKDRANGGYPGKEEIRRMREK